MVLIGATTENPSFALNSALLSRCRVLLLEKLSAEQVRQLLERAVHKVGLEIVGDGEEEEKLQDVLVEKCEKQLEKSAHSVYR